MAGQRSPERRGPRPSIALTEADLETPLGLDDLETAGFAAQYTGRDEAAAKLATRIHHAALKTGDFARAARMAFWIGMAFLQRGDVTQGGGWLGRSAHLLDEHGLDTVTWGYLSIPDGIRKVESDPVGRLPRSSARRPTRSDSATPISPPWRASAADAP